MRGKSSSQPLPGALELRARGGMWELEAALKLDEGDLSLGSYPRQPGWSWDWNPGLTTQVHPVSGQNSTSSSVGLLCTGAVTNFSQANAWRLQVFLGSFVRIIQEILICTCGVGGTGLGTGGPVATVTEMATYIYTQCTRASQCGYRQIPLLVNDLVPQILRPGRVGGRVFEVDQLTTLWRGE